MFRQTSRSRNICRSSRRRWSASAFSEIQAQAILDLQLRRLSALERQKITDEYEEIIKLIAELEEILAQ